MMNANTAEGNDLTGVVITLVTLGITGLVGFEVLNEISKQELVEASKDLETTCAGIGGCGYNFGGLLGVFIIVVFLAVIVSFLLSIRAPAPDDDGDDGDDPDPVAQLQEQYVDGEIQTTVKLERELSDVLDPEVDDATLSEIDDLLGDDDA